MRNYLAAILLFWKSSALLCQLGQLDNTFNTTGQASLHIKNYNIFTSEVLIQEDARILVCGTGTTETNAEDFVIARFRPDGTVDSTFNQTGFRVIDFFGKDDFCYAMALQQDGKILITGIATTLVPKRKTAIVRLLEDGTFDKSFGTNGIVINGDDQYGENPRAIIYQPDESIIVTGSVQVGAATLLCAIFKYEEDGTPDLTFGENGLVKTIVPEGFNPSFGILQEDGKIITGGSLLGNTIESLILRFTTEGVVDSSFGTNGVARINYFNEDHNAYSVAFQADQKLLVVAGITHSGKRDFCVLRYTTNGTIDSTFGTNGRVITPFSSGSNTAHAVSVQDDQKILLAGFLGTTPNHDFALARYTTTGSLDAGFGIGGKVITDFGEDDVAFAMAIQTDKKIVLAGHTIDNAEIGDFAVARYLSGLETVSTTAPPADVLNFELYPNPTVQEARLKYSLMEDQKISIRLYDVTGKIIQRFIENEHKGKGNHEEGLNFNPNIIEGEYILVIETENSI